MRDVLPPSARLVGLWSGLAIAAAGLFAINLINARDMAFGTLTDVIVAYTVLPRAGMAVVAGSALGLAGLLLQRVLRNPLAEPSTLGISAGAQLAMAAATIYWPIAMEWNRELVAVSGGLLAVGISLGLTWRKGLEPVSVVLAGMMVALTATSASAALILANGEYLFSLFTWGGGALNQQSWEPSLWMAARVVFAFIAAVLLLRPLTILSLDDAAARNLGVALHAMRLLVIGLAVWLAASVTAEVGVIGFVGLAAPALAGLSGARTPRQRLFLTPIVGAILLWLADGLVQLFSAGGGERIPTGAATALLGGPLLLWLLPRLRMFEWPTLAATGRSAARRLTHPWRAVTILVGVLAIAIVLALVVGRGPDGWSVATGDLFTDLLAWRGPRVVVAGCAGALVAAAGFIIQRVSANPLASPEILGVGTGAGVGLAACLYLMPAAGPGLEWASAAIGATGVLAIILLMARRSGFGPERLLLAGIALSALGSAVLTAAIATGSPQSYILLTWLSGSTDGADPAQAQVTLIAAAVLLAPLPLAARWLDILPLGQPVAQGIGVPVGRARGGLIILAGLLTATAALSVGPLSFVGLIAPHLVRMTGLARPLPALAGAVALGAGLMVVSDWLARTVAFPYQLPLGLFAALIGGPYLIYLLGRGVERNA